MDFIASQVERIQKESGWGKVCIVIERRKIKCITTTDSATAQDVCDRDLPETSYD